MIKNFPTVFFIGARGSGKTTVGKLLSRELGCEFFDTDLMIMNDTGLSVTDLVTREGWDAFRERESIALRQAGQRSCVVSTGGGMVLSEANRRFMKDSGLVFFLSAPAATLHERLTNNPQVSQRPSLTGLAPFREIESILEEREPLYRATAHHCVDVSVPLSGVLAAVIHILYRKGRNV